ncbi:MAG: hypothetical protein KAX19_06650, partial [Candidatus Brocadiae bacterium]|nr:hypothetical protein [Candidatus Brocadiia bacterium]
GLLMLSVILIECLNGVMLLRVVRRLVPEADLGPLDTLFFMVTVPAAMLLVLYNSLHSLMTNRIRWRGTVYTLLSPRSTLVSRP